MTKKHFIKIAAILAGDLATSTTDRERLKVRGITLSFADMFAQENPNFDRERFYAAVGIEV